MKVVRPAGLEPAACGLGNRRTDDASRLQDVTCDKNDDGVCHRMCQDDQKLQDLLNLWGELPGEARKAIVELARQEGERVSAERLSRELDLPENYLSKTLHALAREGLLDSNRGPGGGYRLAVPADELPLMRIIEAFETLENVRKKGAMHTVIHEKDDTNLPVVAVCNCCWDCCGILRPYNMGALALKYKRHFVARVIDSAECKGCSVCQHFCPTTAASVHDKKAAINPDKCIGCGLCAYHCKQNNIELIPDSRQVFLPLLKKSEIRIREEIPPKTA